MTEVYVQYMFMLNELMLGNLDRYIWSYDKVFIYTQSYT